MCILLFFFCETALFLYPHDKIDNFTQEYLAQPINTPFMLLSRRVHNCPCEKNYYRIMSFDWEQKVSLPLILCTIDEFISGQCFFKMKVSICKNCIFVHYLGNLPNLRLIFVSAQIFNRLYFVTFYKRLNSGRRKPLSFPAKQRISSFRNRKRIFAVTFSYNRSTGQPDDPTLLPGQICPGFR